MLLGVLVVSQEGGEFGIISPVSGMEKSSDGRMSEFSRLEFSDPTGEGAGVGVRTSCRCWFVRIGPTIIRLGVRATVASRSSEEGGEVEDQDFDREVDKLLTFDLLEISFNVDSRGCDGGVPDCQLKTGLRVQRELGRCGAWDSSRGHRSNHTNRLRRTGPGVAGCRADSSAQ